MCAWRDSACLGFGREYATCRGEKRCDGAAKPAGRDHLRTRESFSFVDSRIEAFQAQRYPQWRWLEEAKTYTPHSATTLDTIAARAASQTIAAETVVGGSFRARRRCKQNMGVRLRFRCRAAVDNGSHARKAPSAPDNGCGAGR